MRVEAEFIPLRDAAEKLGVPMSFLRVEAIAGRVPVLRAGRRLLFNIVAVREAFVARGLQKSIDDRTDALTIEPREAERARREPQDGVT